MTDRYERIRAALAMGPTPGPWRCEHETGGGHDCWMIYAGDWPRSGGIVGYYTHTGPRHIPHVRPNIEAVAIAHHIAACDPDTIRELLAERDALAAALEAAREDAERMRRDIADLYKVMPMLPITAETMEAATDWFERYCIEFYREINAALDAAIDQARGKENTNG